MFTDDIDERVVKTAEYVISTGATVRAAAKVFGVSKSTSHKDLTDRLKAIDPALHASVSVILQKNRAERHIRGGNATRIKFFQSRDSRCNKLVLLSPRDLTEA